MTNAPRYPLPGSSGPGSGQAVAINIIALHPHVCWLGPGGLSGPSIF
jgi:hypothetical protein